MKYLFLIFVLPAMLFACRQGEEYTSYIDQLDKAMADVDSARTVFYSLPLDSVGALYSAVKDDMTSVQKKYRGEMPKDRAYLLSRYRDIPNNVKGFSEVRIAIEKEFELGIAQMNNLKEALSSGADIDGKGNKIDQAYVDKYSAEEIRFASALQQKVKQIESGVQKSFLDYDEIYPALSTFLDSVKTLDEPVE